MTWTIIENGKLIDGRCNPPVDACSVLIEGNRIHSVGTDIGLDVVPRGATIDRIDARGKTIMPGLIDAHCHTSFGEARTQEEQDLYTSHELRTLRSAWNVTKVLRAGVTSISDPGGSYYIGVGIREAIKEGLVNGPRMSTAGRFLSTDNGISAFYPTSVGVPQGAIGQIVNTTDEMKRAVREQVKNGVDLIKIADSNAGDYQAFTDDEVKMMTDLVHQLGKKATMHARGSENVAAAVAAGVDWIMHGNVMTDETIAALAASGIPLAPVLTLYTNMADYGHLVGLTQDRRDRMKVVLEKTAETLHRAHAAGVKFITGTDTGFAITPYGEWHAREIQDLVDYAGLTPLEAIAAATGNNGIVLGLEGEIGVLAPGALADVLVVDGDVASDVRILQDKSRITTIMKDGRVVEFDERQLELRTPYDRHLLITQGDLTWDVVHGDGLARPREEVSVGFDEGKVLAAEINAREEAARR